MDIEALDAIAGLRVDRSNARSLLSALESHGQEIMPPHRLAMFLAQAMHESGALRFDRETWGPTPQQKRYDTGPLAERLGNTPEADGDGARNSGRGPFMLTGASNLGAFGSWCRRIGLRSPDFVADPDQLLTDPWEGLSAVWYWLEGNPTGKSLSRYADEGDFETLTLRINGGLTHFGDRCRYYARVALVLLGHPASDLRSWQAAQGLRPDRVAGPRTRAALHKALVALTAPADRDYPVAVAPVTETDVIVPPELDRPQSRTRGFWERIGGIGVLGGILAATQGQDWRVVAVLAAAGIVLLVVGLIFQRRLIGTVRGLKRAGL